MDSDDPLVTLHPSGAEIPRSEALASGFVAVGDGTWRLPPAWDSLGLSSPSTWSEIEAHDQLLCDYRAVKDQALRRLFFVIWFNRCVLLAVVTYLALVVFDVVPGSIVSVLVSTAVAIVLVVSASYLITLAHGAFHGISLVHERACSFALYLMERPWPRLALAVTIVFWATVLLTWLVDAVLAAPGDAVTRMAVAAAVTSVSLLVVAVRKER